MNVNSRDHQSLELPSDSTFLSLGFLTCEKGTLYLQYSVYGSVVGIK